MSFSLGLSVIDKRVKDRRKRRKGRNDLQTVWHNCGLKVRSESGQLLYPLLLKRQEKDYGYSLLLHLPTGLSDVSFRNRQHQISWALGGDLDIEPVNGNLFLRVLTGQIKKYYSYDIAKLPEGLYMPVPVGYGREGLIMLDLADAPHLLLGGGSRSGKSNWLHQAIVTLLRASCEVYIIDLKRLEFAWYKKHATCTHSEQGALEILRYANKEMERRMDLLEGKVVKVQDWQGERLPYIAIVIDEITELKDDKAWELLNRLVRMAAALGISVVAATQRPSTKVIDGDTRALFTARISFRVADRKNSEIILDDPRAAYLPKNKGAAIYRFADSIMKVQTMHLKAPDRVVEILSNIPQRQQQQLVQETELKTR